MSKKGGKHDLEFLSEHAVHVVEAPPNNGGGLEDLLACRRKLDWAILVIFVTCSLCSHTFLTSPAPPLGSGAPSSPSDSLSGGFLSPIKPALVFFRDWLTARNASLELSFALLDVTSKGVKALLEYFYVAVVHLHRELGGGTRANTTEKILWQRVLQIPESMWFNPVGCIMRHFVGKFHLLAHIASCQLQYSWNFARWKTTQAIHKCKESTAFLEHFEKSISPDDINTWTKDVTEWEDNQTRPNPFESRTEILSVAAVCLRLAEEESKNLKDGTSKLLYTDMSKGGLISISNWVQAQSIYISSLTILRLNVQKSNEINHPETMYLWLPSALHGHVICKHNLMRIEWLFRVAQAHNALSSICQNLHLISHLYYWKDYFSQGQSANTRSHVQIEGVEKKINTHVQTYYIAYSALEALQTITSLENAEHCLLLPTELCKLKNTDVRPLQDITTPISQSGKEPTWIWLAGSQASPLLGQQPPDEGMYDAIQVKWYKAKARQMRWAEEVTLLAKEVWWFQDGKHTSYARPLFVRG
ncbi:hypothetical protein CONPUDRAFT_72357 [Coniophora puteana RWD-64-598 SS2]|uniref:Uncharacterized protein n=1 Tax=Coniophora puteana (strain RWD-64-598) TaxID=741705 RepID=A0A5M3MS88_CONPW|nr:uncharacterized protein CONPUDRAFT_72357 [Coniophora puteana RWD-64-598 SS2]EIW82022.1 hypothetical protein CONPUDRAFT_72357 [Coniophora puteana RWD-64-598 SS2]